MPLVWPTARRSRSRGRLRDLVARCKGLQKLLAALLRDERGVLGKSPKPIPTGGLLSKGHMPKMPTMPDPFTGQPGGITGRAGTARSLRTAIDATGAEFETFNMAVRQRGEIGLQSPGGANAPGVDFVTARRRAADGLMEVLLNDATVNQRKKAKTIPPDKWVDEAREAAAQGRLDIGDVELEEEIRDALNADRFRVRTLTVTLTPQGKVNVVGW